MRVVVCGGAGFLGSHVCELFRGLGDEVLAVDNLTKFELSRNWYDASVVRKYNLDFLDHVKASFLCGDICDYDLMRSICRDADFIVNCAAQPAMTIAIEDPVLDFRTNVCGVFNLLEVSREFDVPFAHCSSIHVFGNNINNQLVDDVDGFSHPGIAINEDYKLLDGELTPLHSSKRAMEVYIQSYIDTYSLKALCLRLTGIYGSRQFGGEDHGWVANFAIRTLMGKPITVFGTDKQVRDVLYVSDAANVFDCFYRNQKSGVYNCGGGTGNILSISECLRLLSKITGKDQDITFEDKRKGDLYWFVCNNSLITSRLGWTPSIKPVDGLPLLVSWVVENRGLFR